MRSSSSRMIRPRSFWGSAVAGLALTFVVPASADDAAPAAKPATPVPTKSAPVEPGAKGVKPASLKGAPEARKEKGPHERGEGRDNMEGGKKGDKAHHPGKGPDVKSGIGKKPRLAPNPKRAMSEYGEALAELRQAKATVEAAPPEEAAKAKKELLTAQRAVRRAERGIRSAHRSDAMRMLNMSPEERKKLEMKLQVHGRKLAADRKERAQKRQDELKKEFGEKVSLEPVRAELELHAWRVARLERLVAIAEAAGRPESATRAKELLEKEKAAHPARLKSAAAGAKASPGAPKAPAAGANKVPAAAGATPKASTTATPAPTKPAAAPAKEAAQ